MSTGNFTLLENEAIGFLKGSTLAVYFHMKSKRTNWMFYLDVMATQTGYCRTTIQRAVRKLMNLGVVTRTRIRLSKGIFGGFEYCIKSIRDAKEAIQAQKRNFDERMKKAKELKAKKKAERILYSQKNPLISKDFTTGTFFAPSNNSETLDNTNCINYANNIPDSKPKNGWKFSDRELKEQKEYVLRMFSNAK